MIDPFIIIRMNYNKGQTDESSKNGGDQDEYKR